MTVGTTSYTYDEVGHVKNILSKDGTAATISNLTYTYDAAERLETENDGTLTTFTYDNANQVTADGATTVIYDATGNRTTVTTAMGPIQYWTDPGNQLQSDGVWDYSYDDEGNRIGKTLIGTTGEHWTFDYDHRNRLVEAKHYTTTVSLAMEADYAYDVFGNRTEKVVYIGVTTTTTRYAYDFLNPAKPSPVGNENSDIWATFDVSSSLTTRQLQGDGVDDHLAFIVAGNTRWNLADRLGSVRTVLDDTGSPVDELKYDAFGEILPGETAPAERGLYAYTGREFDGETSFQFHHARYFDPDVGRWVTQDPIGFAAGDVNLYRYVSNVYTLATDPSGYFPELRDRLGNIIRIDEAPRLMQGADPIQNMVDGQRQAVIDIFGQRTQIENPTPGTTLLPNVQTAGPQSNELPYFYFNTPREPQIRVRTEGDLEVAREVEQFLLYQRFSHWWHLEGGMSSFIGIGSLITSGSPSKPQNTRSRVVINSDGTVCLWQREQAQTRINDWQPGDTFLVFPRQGNPQADWRLNSSLLRNAMRSRSPIFDTHIDPVTREQLPARPFSFLRMERDLLESHGWRYNRTIGGYVSPIFE